MGSGISEAKGTVHTKYDMDQVQPREKGRGRRARSTNDDETVTAEEPSDTSGSKAELTKCSSCGELRRCAPRGKDKVKLCAACTLKNASSAAGAAAVAVSRLRNRIPQNFQDDTDAKALFARSGTQAALTAQEPRRIRRAESLMSLEGGTEPPHQTPILRKSNTQALLIPGAVSKLQANKNEVGSPRLLVAHAAGPKLSTSSHDHNSDLHARLRKSRTAAFGGTEDPQVASLAGGDEVVTLVARQRHGTVIMEVGHAGRIVTRTGITSSNPDNLLVQFHSGYDWRLASHQMCPRSSLPAVLEAGLPGGYQWGDKVRSLTSLLFPGSPDELRAGDQGCVIGPGSIPGKVAVRFDAPVGEWSLWPGLLCVAEKYGDSKVHALPGGFKQGEHVRPQMSLRGFQGGSSLARKLGDNDQGTVIGPGHVPGRLLVQFGTEGGSCHWSLLPKQLLHISTAK